MPGALDLAGLDLEVGHRVGAGALGEHQVAVELVGVGALGARADEHVADPHGVRGVALQRALVLDVGAAVRRPVVDEEAVLEVLPGIGEVDAQALERAAGAGVAGVGVEPDDAAADRHGDVPHRGVAADDQVVLGEVVGVVVPLLHGDEGDLRAVAGDDRDDLAVLGRCRRARARRWRGRTGRPARAGGRARPRAAVPVSRMRTGSSSSASAGTSSTSDAAAVGGGDGGGPVTGRRRAAGAPLLDRMPSPA